MMLLRSTSTPILSSIIEPHHSNSDNLLRSPSIPLNGCKVSLPRDPLPATSHPIKIRRVHSDGNLNAAIPADHSDRHSDTDSPIGYRHSDTDSPIRSRHSEIDSPIRFQESGFTFPWHNKSTPARRLKPIPSFSLYRRDGAEEDADDEDENEDGQEQEFSFPIADFGNVDHKGSEAAGGFDLIGLLNGKENTFPEMGKWSDLKATPMYMATGLGIDGLASRVRGSKVDHEGMQQHYEKMIREDPCNSLILGNYARYLYEIKRDYKKAEEFYSRAILAGPESGEVLSEYAKLRWEVYREEELSNNYFEQAMDLFPQNSHVLAAYASFLWKTDGGEEKESTKWQHPCYAHGYN